MIGDTLQADMLGPPGQGMRGYHLQREGKADQCGFVSLMDLQPTFCNTHHPLMAKAASPVLAVAARPGWLTGMTTPLSVTGALQLLSAEYAERR